MNGANETLGEFVRFFFLNIYFGEERDGEMTPGLDLNPSPRIHGMTP